VDGPAGQPGATVVDLAGLTRSDAAGGFEDEFSGLAAEIRTLHQGRSDGPAPERAGPAPTDPHPPDGE